MAPSVRLLVLGVLAALHAKAQYMCCEADLMQTQFDEWNMPLAELAREKEQILWTKVQELTADMEEMRRQLRECRHVAKTSMTPQEYKTRDDPTMLKEFMKWNQEYNEKRIETVYGWSLLHYVSKNSKKGADQSARLVAWLLDQGEDVNAKGKGGETPLYLASEEGNKNVVRILLDYKADINETNDGNQTPLHIASWNGRHGVVGILLEKGANVNHRDNTNNTPLTLAREEGYASVCELLEEYGGVD